MNGHIIPGTPIAVDFWKKRECPSAKFFFLTHLHGDHTVGLSSSWQYNIYCSEITSKLLMGKYHIKDDLVIVLETGSSHIIYLDEEKQEQMVVSVIDANHCPGSVMFLFEGYFGKVLYTGDFRYSDTMFVDIPLPKCSNIDILYLDNTYCTKDCVFPTREQATENILSLIQQHADHRILIGMRNLGKEELLVKIAENTQEWISVSSSMYQTAEILGLSNVFCVDDMDCKIRVVPVHTITRSNVLGWNDYEPTLAIIPSALYTGLGCSPYSDCANIHVIPYSDHSNFEEICTFVDRVKPKFIQPIVNERPRGGIFSKFSERSDMSCLDKYLSTESTTKFTIPPTVKKFMSIPLNTYMRKVSTQKKQGIKMLRVKKKVRASLGVVFYSPCKTEDDISAQEFERQLENIRRSFKPVPKSKKNLEISSSVGENSEVAEEAMKEDRAKGDNKIAESKVDGSETIDSDELETRGQNVENCSSKDKIQCNLYEKTDEDVNVHVLAQSTECGGEGDNTSIKSDSSCSIHIEIYSSASESENEEMCMESPYKSDALKRTNTVSKECLEESNEISKRKVSKSSVDRFDLFNTDEKCDRSKFGQGQTTIDSWFHSAITMKHSQKSQKVCTQSLNNNRHTTDLATEKRIQNEMKSDTVLCKKNMSTSDKIRLVPLKPMNLKRNFSSEFNVVPINKDKRPTNKDLIIQPLKKRKSLG